MSDDGTLRPAGRFEWEQILRRIDPDSMPLEIKGFALIMGTYADADGTRVRPGNKEMLALTGRSPATVKRYTARLRSLGLLTLVSRGGGRDGQGKTTEYRLSIPTDLLDRIDLVPPSQRVSGLRAVSPETEGTGLTKMSPQNEPFTVDDEVSGLTMMSPETEPSAVDNSGTGLIQVSPQSARHPVDSSVSGLIYLSPENGFQGSNNGVPERLRAQIETLGAHSSEPLPDHYTNHLDQPSTHYPAQPLTAREPVDESEPDSAALEAARLAALDPPTIQIAPVIPLLLADSGRCPHGQPLVDDRGEPDCVPCREIGRRRSAAVP